MYTANDFDDNCITRERRNRSSVFAAAAVVAADAVAGAVVAKD